MPRTKEQNEAIRAEKRQLIMNVAMQLFAEEGFAQTSIEKIARKADIARGLMYSYFKSKEDLLQNIWDGLMSEFENMIDPNHDGQVTDEEAEDFIDKLFDYLKNKRSVYRLYFQLSFQPKVLEFLLNGYNAEAARRKQSLIIETFCRKLSGNDMKFNYFTVLVFLKGISLVTAYTENIYTNDFLDTYRETLKKQLGISANVRNYVTLHPCKTVSECSESTLYPCKMVSPSEVSTAGNEISCVCPELGMKNKE
ncbi:MAG: TetR/AcrR family transcriptional regulator [Prevotellaceae bacterium]|jgi:AcrR family transcriptional regulator|nr:TetR/AcrR family transcriptional regulator [Prevotellaceae bacterium]